MYCIIIAIILAIASFCRICSGYDAGTGLAGLFIAVIIAGYEVCPNVIEVVDKSVDLEKRVDIRKKYGIPTNKKVFVYGGNLGKPQGIPFIIDCLKAEKDNNDVFFLMFLGVSCVLICSLNPHFLPNEHGPPFY